MVVRDTQEVSDLSQPAISDVLENVSDSDN